MKKINFFLFLFTVCSSLVAQTTRIEAESGTLTGGASVSFNASLSGGQYVQMQTGNISLSINITTETYFDFYVYTASPNGEKTQNFVIDGNSATFTLANNSNYIRLKVASFVKLSAGSHTIAITNNWGWIDVDYIEMEQIDPANRFNVSPTLCTPNPSPEAACMYNFLREKYGNNILSGVMTLNSFDDSNWLKNNVGQEPVVLGIDFMQTNRGYTWYDDNTPTNDAKTWYNKGGIPIMCWHWRDPSRATEEFYTAKTTFDVSKINNPASTEYAQMISDIDFVAEKLKVLRDQGIPVIWRPLHEAAGGWFWWGAKSGADCKQLWLVMYDRMVNYHGLNNLIWVWTYEPVEDGTWYPGDDYVDIVGRDIYKDGDHSSQIMEFNNMNNLYSGNKIITESECGSFPDVDNLVADGAAWSWFMPWYGDYTESATYNSLALWQKMFASSYVITLNEMPGWTTYCSVANTPPVVSITLPVNAAKFVAPATITINANATDSDGTVSKVEFYNGATKLGEDVTSSYSYSWTNVAAGTYSITAIAYDNDNDNTTSSVISIEVLADSDSDGTPDVTDGCPNDPNKIAAGNCGCGIVEGTCSQDIAIETGWNLISFNVLPTDKSVSQVLQTIDFDLLKNENGFYKVGNTLELQSIVNVAIGGGYLLYSNESATVTINGASDPLYSSTSLKAGWNLVGVPILSNYAISNLPSQVVVVKDFNAFYESGNVLGLLTELKPTKAYFMYATTDCVINW